MGVQPIDTDFKGPLPKDTVGLLLGRSSSALKGLQITPGLIDPGYTWDIYYCPPNSDEYTCSKSCGHILSCMQSYQSRWDSLLFLLATLKNSIRIDLVQEQVEELYKVVQANFSQSLEQSRLLSE